MTSDVYGIFYDEYVSNYLYEPSEKFRSEGKYYHYTSLENCLKMLQNNNGSFELWASHLSYLNDKEEHINGLNLINRKVEDLLLSKGDDLSDWIEEYRERRETEMMWANEIFILCFCSNRSLLSQWKYYGKNSGIAIQYNLDNCEYSGYIEPGMEISLEQDVYIRNYAQKVIYDNMEKQKIIDEFIRQNIYNIYQSDRDKVEKYRMIFCNMNRLYSLAPLFKHDSFEEESESRLLFRPLYLSADKDARKLIHYRTSDGKIIPFMKIRIRGREEGSRREPVINSLTIGPGQNQDLIFEALKHFVSNSFPKDENSFDLIHRKDYAYIKVNGIEIRKASIPFRG